MNRVADPALESRAKIMDADGTRRTGGIRSDEDHFTLHAAGTPTARGRFVRAAGLEPVSDTPSAAQAGGVVVPVGPLFRLPWMTLSPTCSPPW